MKVSIIIPVYQAEAVLKRCINSILHQTFTDYEIILINDGSKDTSAEICNEFASKCKNVLVFHQENAGPSAARNKGLEEAKGEYVVFIDADDYVGDKYLEGFFILNRSPKNALVQQGYTREDSTGKKLTFDYENKNYNTAEFSRLFLEAEFIRRFPFPWGKLFETNIIKENQLKFPLDIRFGEDLIFLLNYIKHVNQVIIVNENHYVYGYNTSSLTQHYQDFSNEITRFNLVHDLLEHLHEIFSFSSETVEYNRRYIARYLQRAFKSLYVGNYKKERNQRVLVLKNLDVKVKRYFIYNSNEGKFGKAFSCLYYRKYYYLLDVIMHFGFAILPILRKKLKIMHK